ncbi:nuclease-related domain-containing protein [Neobacillus dielmonensis]|uniref:nuclease-related domain-containing protein n=1 Tax=Neobacillus dielmonensis TaxID=1347369 RepID=UPI0005A95AD9|nr:nuclease-related domain-containing protein [Neobacillus dielmonensis]
MYAKKFQMPTILAKAEALERRTPKGHPVLLELAPFIKNLMSGCNGEKKINYFLKQIPTQRFHIFHDLRLPYGDSYFQLDFVLLSPKVIILLDGKNHSGKLTIEQNQMTQEYQEKRLVYENPISQANRHKLLLNYFFAEHKIPQIPIESLVVISKSTTELSINPSYTEAQKKVCRASNLIEKIEVIYNRYNRDQIDNKMVNQIKKLLLKSHTPLEVDILSKFNMLTSEIIPGVQCPRCFLYPMSYKRNNWICSFCDFVSQDAYLQAIADYFLLIKSSFSNPEIRAFLLLASSRATSYILSLTKFPYSGATKGRIYYQPKDFL